LEIVWDFTGVLIMTEVSLGLSWFGLGTVNIAAKLILSSLIVFIRERLFLFCFFPRLVVLEEGGRRILAIV
jgi:hypothetical protein